MPRQIQGSQTDFSFGEVDPDLKRNDSHPARKGGLRQMLNARIHNSGTIQNRPGRSALFPMLLSARVEEITISPGNLFLLSFTAGQLQVLSRAGVVVATFVQQGSTAPLPWVTLDSIDYTIFNLSVYITFPGMRPQVVTWDGVSMWSIADYIEQLNGGQKRTPFVRISPQGITLQPAAQTGASVALSASAPLFVAGMVGTRMRFVGRQITIIGVTNPQTATIAINESLPGSQALIFPSDPSVVFSVGDVVLGSVSGSKGLVASINVVAANTVEVQLLSNSQSVTVANSFLGGGTTILAFLSTDIVVGPGGSLKPTTVSVIQAPQPCPVWDEEVMNSFRGFPSSCFTDQYRVGFTNFPALPGGILWSGINAPTDAYANDASSPANAIFEIVPGKAQTYYVVPGPEGSEFVFCDRGVYYIPISTTNPLVPGSVGFSLLSGDGAARVRPRLAQQLILYVNAGGNSMMAVIATGSITKPFNTRSLSDFHAHLFTGIRAIAAPNADGTYNERYAYVLNQDGSLIVGKYEPESLQTSPVIGWGPWSGAGVVQWVAAWNADVIFSTQYFGTQYICEILDDTKYMDSAIFVNNPPPGFAPPFGKGPLWFAVNQSVFLMDQVSRPMGVYQVDANGFIVPQNNGGEDLTAASLVAGQIWSGAAEPFAPDVPSGADQHQRMEMRSFSYFGVYVIHSTGLVFASIFSGKQTRLGPVVGTIERTQRVPAYNQDDNTLLPPIQRETVEKWPPPGSSYDPRAAVLWDTPGPIEILEFAMEISL